MSGFVASPLADEGVPCGSMVWWDENGHHKGTTVYCKTPPCMHGCGRTVADPRKKKETPTDAGTPSKEPARILGGAEASSSANDAPPANLEDS